MRYYLLLLFLMLAPSGASASPPATNVPRDYSALMDQSNVAFLQDLATQIKDAGYRDVQIIPQMFVAAVKKADGTSTLIIVDYNTLHSTEVPNALDFSIGAKNTRPETGIPKLHPDEDEEN